MKEKEKLNHQLSEDTIEITFDDGTKMTCIILFTYEDKNHNNYVVYENIETTELNAAKYYPNEENNTIGKLEDIQTDEEWEMLSALLEQYYDELDEEK